MRQAFQKRVKQSEQRGTLQVKAKTPLPTHLLADLQYIVHFTLAGHDMMAK